MALEWSREQESWNGSLWILCFRIRGRQNEGDQGIYAGGADGGCHAGRSGAFDRLTDTLVSWFNSENSVQMAQYAHTGMRMYFVGYFFAGFNIMAAGYLSAVNRPVEASVTSICRGMVAIVACSLVLSAVFGMPGVWAAFPASELLTALLTLFLLRRKENGKA